MVSDRRVTIGMMSVLGTLSAATALTAGWFWPTPYVYSFGVACGPEEMNGGMECRNFEIRTNRITGTSQTRYEGGAWQ